jgi:hypothetical protein
MDSGVARVIECFPRHAAVIRDRFHADQGFREMCGDYAETLEALERWQVSTGPQAADRIDEYRELARALESEIATELRLAGWDTEPRDDRSEGTRHA